MVLAEKAVLDEDEDGSSTSWLKMISISRGVPGWFSIGTTEACEETHVDAAERLRLSTLFIFLERSTVTTLMTPLGVLAPEDMDLLTWRQCVMDDCTMDLKASTLPGEIPSKVWMIAVFRCVIKSR